METLLQLHTTKTERIVSDIQNKVCKILELPEKWSKIGKTELDVSPDLDSLYQIISVNILNFYEKEVNYCAEITNSVEVLSQKCEQFCTKLSMKFEDFFQDFEQNRDSLTLLEQNKFLNSKLDQLDSIKRERIETYKNRQKECGELLTQLKMNDRADMDFMNMDVNFNQVDYIPSISCLEDFKRHNLELKQKIDNRLNSLKNSQNRYIDVISKLSEVPDDETFENRFIYTSEFTDFSDDYLEQVNKIVRNIERKLAQRKSDLVAASNSINSIILKLNLKYEGLRILWNHQKFWIQKICCIVL